MSTLPPRSHSSFPQVHSLTAVALASTIACTSLGARAADDPRALHRVEIEDEEGVAYELRDARDAVVDQCRAPCALLAPSGDYRLRATRRGHTDDAEFTLIDAVEVRREPSSYAGVAAGVPMMVVGSIFLLGGVSIQTEMPRGSTNSVSTSGLTVMFVGAVFAGVGIALSTTAHGSSLEVTSKRAEVATLSVTVAPTAGGGGLAFKGSF